MTDTNIDNIDMDNPELKQALQIIHYTRNSLFLTGKAGTGKSTLLRYIASTTKKKHVILAPTGIAAINAGGVTLHSFCLTTHAIRFVTFATPFVITVKKLKCCANLSLSLSMR